MSTFFSRSSSPALTAGRRRHLCRVEEGGSIFAISGVRGRSGGGLLAVGAGPAQLLKFARGDLIRLSFEEGLSEQVAVLDRRLGDPRRPGVGPIRRARNAPELEPGGIAEFERETRFGVREGVAWVRQLLGTSMFLDRVPLHDGEIDTRFPLTEHLWLTAVTSCRVTVCDTTAMIRTGDPWAGLDDFHRAILDFIAVLDEQETQTRWVEFERSIAHETALVQSASSRLAAAANTASLSAVDPGGDALVTACRAVGQDMGIEVRARQSSGDEFCRTFERPAGRPGADRRFSRPPSHARRRLVAPAWRRPALGTNGRRRTSTGGTCAGPVGYRLVRAGLRDSR